MEQEKTAQVASREDQRDAAEAVRSQEQLAEDAGADPVRRGVPVEPDGS